MLVQWHRDCNPSSVLCCGNDACAKALCSRLHHARVLGAAQAYSQSLGTSDLSSALGPWKTTRMPVSRSPSWLA